MSKDHMPQCGPCIGAVRTLIRGFIGAILQKHCKEVRHDIVVHCMVTNIVSEELLESLKVEQSKLLNEQIPHS